MTEAPATPIVLDVLQTTAGQNPLVLWTLTIPANAKTSNVIDINSQPNGIVVLQTGWILSMNIRQVGSASAGSPGKDLTVTIRF